MQTSPSTRVSLIVRICDDRDMEAWSQSVEIYAPLVYEYLGAQGLQDADAADLTQDVLTSVATAANNLNYSSQRGPFRSWLFTVVKNRLRNFRRKSKRQTCGTGGTEAHELLMQQPDRDAVDWDQAYERRLFHHAADQVRGDFQESTWQAFWRTAVEGQAGKEVAESLGMTISAVYLAKGRVMQRIREQVNILQGE